MKSAVKNDLAKFVKKDPSNLHLGLDEGFFDEPLIGIAIAADLDQVKNHITGFLKEREYKAIAPSLMATYRSGGSACLSGHGR